MIKMCKRVNLCTHFPKNSLKIEIRQSKCTIINNKTTATVENEKVDIMLNI